MTVRLALTLFVAMAGPVVAQDNAQTLADIRQQLAVLNVEMLKLRGELNTTGGPVVSTGGSTVIERVNSIETELQRLTQATERMEFRIESVARDGSSRIEDLRFQLCELTSDCDLNTLPTPGALGGDARTGAAEAPATSPPTEGGAEFAVGERGDFDRAQAALEAGDNTAAAQGFAAFVGAYPTGPLSAEAQFLRGQALARDSQPAEAARAYLESFSGTPEGPRAPEALLGLGTALGALGQSGEACLTLSEVAIRFPQSPAIAQAASVRASLGCS